MWKTKNNQPMSQEEAYKKFIEYGYQPLRPYVNNMVKIPCFDKDGYIVMIARASLGRVQQYQRFSLSSNAEFYLYNMNLYATYHHYPSIVITTVASSIKNHVNLVCRCSCGDEFVCDANNWIRGIKTRCNKCVNKISNIEKEVEQFLIAHNINFEKQKKFIDCKDIRCLPFDFYLPEYNMCIEVDGEQHYNSHSKFYKKSRTSWEDRKRKDNIKNIYCQEQNIILLRLKYTIIHNGCFEKILKNKLNIH